MKRGRGGGSVTGGSGDIKPQIITLSTGIATAVDIYDVNKIALPVSRFGQTKTKATVLEILKIWYYPSLRNIIDPNFVAIMYLSTTEVRSDGAISNTITMVEDIANPATIAPVIWTTESGTGLSVSHTHEFPLLVDLTDSNGNGVLIATESLFITGGDEGASFGDNFTAKVLYRLVEIGLTEYIGIVQSQS